MRERNLSMIRARGWCSKASVRVLEAVRRFSLTWLVTCSNTSDIKSLRPDSRAVDEDSASVSGQLHSNGRKGFKKKPSIYILSRLCQSAGGLPNSTVTPKIKKAESSNMEAAAIDGKIQRNTPVTSGSSLKESISAMEFERPEIVGDLNAGRSELVSAVEDACKQFRNCVIEMVVEGKNARDLIDVEELLYCYQNISCPFYRDLLSRFFVEICSDIFADSASSSSDDDEELSGSSVF